MVVSARLSLPLLAPGQAQKEVFHNEALQALDILVQGVVEGQADEPPAVPALGAAYLVGRDPIGAWAGHGHAVACWTGGGWRFREAFEGLEVTVRRSGLKARFDGEDWQVGVLDATELRVNGEPVVAARQPAISGPEGGTTIDEEARATLQAILAALRAHGLIAAK